MDRATRTQHDTGRTAAALRASLQTGDWTGLLVIFGRNHTSDIDSHLDDKRSFSADGILICMNDLARVVG